MTETDGGGSVSDFMYKSNLISNREFSAFICYFCLSVTASSEISEHTLSPPRF